MSIFGAFYFLSYTVVKNHRETKGGGKIKKNSKISQQKKRGGEERGTNDEIKKQK